MTAEDTAKAITLSATDVDSSALTYAIVSGPAHGTLSGTAPTLTYTPAANYNGVDAITFKANDGTADSNVATVSITVTGVNDAPVASDQAVVTAEDTAKAITLSATDVDSVALTYAIVSGPAHGTLTGTAPSVTYTPALNYNGSDSFTFNANDGTIDSNVATVSIAIDAVNDAPVAADGALATTEDTPTSGTLVATDVDADSLTYSIVANGAKGAATITNAATGAFTYAPQANANGADSVTFKASDGTVDSNVATVSITIAAVNDAPVATDDSYSTNEDTILAVAAPGVLGNDTDIDSTSFTAMVVAPPAHGAVTLHADGSFSYAPAADYNGPDSFTYKANDGSADSNVATVSIAVNAVNDAPVAANDSYEVDKNTTLTVDTPGVLSNDSDIDSGVLTAVVVSGAAHGTLALSPNGSFTYTPAGDYVGIDTFAYRANDGSADSMAATVTITVNVQSVTQQVSGESTEPTTVTTKTEQGGDGATPSDPLETAVTVPAGVGGKVSITETVTTQAPAAGYRFFDQQINITAPTASPGNPLILKFQLDASIVPPGQNEITLQVFRNGQPVANCNAGAGTTASPDPCVSSRSLLPGGDVEFTVLTSAASAWNIGRTIANAAPIAANDSYDVDEDSPLTWASPGVLTNDIDADGNTLTAVLVDGPSHGVLTLSANGSFTYMPAANFNGADSFTYKANDGTVDSTVATVAITINPVNDAPVAANDSYSTDEDTTLTISAPGVLGNDSDIDGDAMSTGTVSGPSHGTLTLNADGSFTYTPNANYNGPDSFTYEAYDASSESNVATVSIAVNAVNDAPVAASDSYSTNEDTPLTIAAPGVLGNDSDIDSATITAALVAGPAHGTLILNANGGFIYTPAGDYNGADSFTYKANDGSLDSSVATVAITVNAVNDAPVAASDSYSTNEDTPLTIAAPGVLGNDSDIDSATITAVLVAGPAHGTLTLNANGGFTYTPAGELQRRRQLHLQGQRRQPRLERRDRRDHGQRRERRAGGQQPIGHDR